MILIFNFQHEIILFINTVKPVYNELGYNEFPVITQHIVFTDRIDFFKDRSVITKTRF
jgi:hypothetical protein